jgi:hypothetical protein
MERDSGPVRASLVSQDDLFGGKSTGLFETGLDMFGLKLRIRSENVLIT